LVELKDFIPKKRHLTTIKKALSRTKHYLWPYTFSVLSNL